MLHLGLDLSRKRLDVCVLNEVGTKLAVTQAPPDLDGLRHLAKEVAALGGPVNAAIESMNGARFVHDSLELMGWDVEIADAQKLNAKGSRTTCLQDRRVNRTTGTGGTTRRLKGDVSRYLASLCLTTPTR